MQTKTQQQTGKINTAGQKKCPGCKHLQSIIFFKLESVPVFCNVLWKNRNEALAAPRGMIHLAYCYECGLIYNAVFDPQLMKYSSDYENSLHFSPYFQKYATNTANRLIRRYQLVNKDIIEIGCGQGDFLNLLCRLGRNRGIGFDPGYTKNTNRYLRNPDVRIFSEVYSGAHKSFPVDFLCCRHVLEHIGQPLDFLRSIRRVIGSRYDCVVYFEVPNTYYTTRDMGVWDIIYEHCCYFTSQSLTKLFVRSGFEPIEVAEYYEGQFLAIEARPNCSEAAPAVEVEPLVKNINGMIRNFYDAYRKKLDLWQCRLSRLKKEKKRVVLWGAGSKGTTFLNTLDISHKWIEYIVDLNPHKHGHFIAGTGQQVVAPDFLKEYKAQIVIIMNPIYHLEIKQMIRGLGIDAEVLVA